MIKYTPGCVLTPRRPTFVLDDEGQIPVVYENAFSRLNDLHQILVVEPQEVLGARLLVLVVYRDGDRVATLDFRLRVHALTKDDGNCY